MSVAITVDVLDAARRSSRGIPAILFIDDVDKLLAERKVTVEPVLESLQVMHQKYKASEANFLHAKRRLKAQVPEIEASLKVVRDLAARKAAGGEPATAHFLLADQLYARATVAPEDKVCLWLGANVMLEYTYAEADALLAEQLAVARVKAAEAAEDLDFVRDQIVVTEVNMARVFNFDVIKRRREKNAKAGAASGSSE